jgi:uncharacterized protein YjbJ (UPF0337 family)
MNEDRIEGTAKNAGGKLQEGLGRATGDIKSQVEGTVKQAVGSAQELYGQARESAGAAAAMVRRSGKASKPGHIRPSRLRLRSVGLWVASGAPIETAALSVARERAPTGLGACASVNRSWRRSPESVPARRDTCGIGSCRPRGLGARVLKLTSIVCCSSVLCGTSLCIAR